MAPLRSGRLTGSALVPRRFSDKAAVPYRALPERRLSRQASRLFAANVEIQEATMTRKCTLLIVFLVLVIPLSLAGLLSPLG